MRLRFQSVEPCVRRTTISNILVGSHSTILKQNSPKKYIKRKSPHKINIIVQFTVKVHTETFIFSPWLCSHFSPRLHTVCFLWMFSLIGNSFLILVTCLPPSLSLSITKCARGDALGETMLKSFKMHLSRHISFFFFLPLFFFFFLVNVYEESIQSEIHMTVCIGSAARYTYYLQFVSWL